MPEISTDQEVIGEDQQAQAQAEYAEARQKSRVQQLVDQRKQGAKQAATAVAQKQAKSLVRRIIIDVLIAIFANPWTYVILLAIFVIIIGYSCLSNLIECGQIVGLEGLIEALDFAA